MKANYSGAEVGGSYGFSPNKGHWANRSYFAVAGTTAGDTSVTVTTEWKKSDPLIQKEHKPGSLCPALFARGPEYCLRSPRPRQVL